MIGTPLAQSLTSAGAHRPGELTLKSAAASAIQ